MKYVFGSFAKDVYMNVLPTPDNNITIYNDDFDSISEFKKTYIRKWKNNFDYNNIENEIYNLRRELIKTFNSDYINDLRYMISDKEFIKNICSYIKDNYKKTELLVIKKWLVYSFPYEIDDLSNNKYDDYWDILTIENSNDCVKPDNSEIYIIIMIFFISTILIIALIALLIGI